jgi:hypothetical protein
VLWFRQRRWPTATVTVESVAVATAVAITVGTAADTESIGTVAGAAIRSIRSRTVGRTTTAATTHTITTSTTTRRPFTILHKQSTVRRLLHQRQRIHRNQFRKAMAVKCLERLAWRM